MKRPELAGRCSLHSWLAAGSQVPCRSVASMIRRALEDGAGEVSHIYLYQGARTREWMYDVDRFRALEGRGGASLH